MYLLIVKDTNDNGLQLLEVPAIQIKAGSTVMYGAERRQKTGKALCDSFETQDPDDIIRTMGAAQPLEKVTGIVRIEMFEWE